MKKTLLLIGMTLILIHLSAYLTETASLEMFLTGTEENCDYDNWISHISEGIAVQNYNLYAPYDNQTNGFGGYHTPSSNELTQWSDIVSLFLSGMLQQAQDLIDQAGFPYQVVEFNDTDTDRTYYMLREIPNWEHYDDNGTPNDTYDDELGAFDYGWGLYIYNPEAQRPIIITVVHPNDDFPATIMAYEAFTVWDAPFLLISGAGREVSWTNYGTYTNSKSLSDPSRIENHPFNVAYQRFADKIRTEQNRREFSAQIHSYDWNRHEGMASNQISAGYNKLCPNLPIRDLSSRKNDLINKGEHLMIPANTIGIHDDVYLNDYYTVNYSIYDFTFSDGEHEYPVNNAITLPGYSLNRQTLYTLNGWNDYDTIDPFFHIEMDELPNAYDETENNYKWFYGWNEDIAKWDYNNTYTNIRQYYSRWINDLDELYDDMFPLNDEMDPTMPDNFTVINSSMYYATLGWDKSDSYDFDSYEILYATEPIGENNYQIFDRNNASALASLACTSINVTGLNSSNNYYFKIRARDKNGNYSDTSYEVTTIPAPANITNFSAHGMTNSIRLYWVVGSTNGLLGYNLYRKPLDGEWEMIDSYASNPYLTPGNSYYEYWDTDLPNGQHFTYRISMVDEASFEYIHNAPQSAVAEIVHELHLSNASGTRTDTIEFGNNAYASDEQDSYWDTSKTNPNANYVWLAFWQPYWGQYGTQLSREVKGGYDLDTEMKTWTVRVRSDQLNVPLFLSVPTAETRSEKLYIYDAGTGNWHNLQDGPYEFTVSNSNIRTMTLYWGNLQPRASHAYMENQIFQGGNTINFSWSNINPFLIDHTNLYIKNATDSLAIYLDVPAYISNYSYIIPQAVDMPQAKAYIEVVSTDGVHATYPSPYTFAIVPRMNLLYTEPGWSTRSNPFINDIFSIPELFGDGAMGYIWDEDWMQTNDFFSGIGYFVEATNNVFNTSTSDILAFETDIEIEPGWNFVANPHMCHYDISSLKFTVNGTPYNFSEMLGQKLISKAIYVYRNGSYQLVDRIEPQEAFFIKSYASPGNNIVMSFYPYYEAPQVLPPAPIWSLKLTAQGAVTDADEIIIGASPIGSDGYDFRLDLPKAPEKTLFPSLTMYIEPTITEEFPESALQQELRYDFNQEESTQQFNFILDSDEAQTVDFSVAAFNIPEEWTVRFYLEDNPASLYDGENFSMDIPEAGTYAGRIVIYNHPVSNQDLVSTPLGRISAYPNPFNPEVTISFNIPVAMNCSIDIFNIRGQKVRNIHNGILSAGSHNIKWNGKDMNGRSVASGMYFARINTPNTSRSIKMMLMK